MLAELVNNEKAEPLAPDGWVFIVDAMIAFMNSIDDQRVSVTKLESYRSTYNDLHALAPKDTIQRKMARSQISAERLDNVRMSARGAASHIARACEAGRVASATRYTRGGPLVPLPAYKWGLDDPWPRMWSCQMEPKHPFALNVGHWIFFEQRSLHEEIDNWRLQHGLERIWTTEVAQEPEAQPAPSSPEIPNQEPVKSNGGGRPVDAEKWGNLVAVLGAYAINSDIGLMKPGSLHGKLSDYAAKVGLGIPSVSVARPALKLALDMLHRDHSSNGQPMFDADGNLLE